MMTTAKGATMNYGQAVKTTSTNLGRMAADSKAERNAAIQRLMAQGLTLEQAAAKWAASVVA